MTNCSGAAGRLAPVDYQVVVQAWMPLDLITKGSLPDEALVDVVILTRGYERERE
jgi:hypothetical protein